MEYATRDQAQNAVTTLSNQNLLGRLVYVREVRRTALTRKLRPVLSCYRIVNPSHGLMHLAVVWDPAICVEVAFKGAMAVTVEAVAFKAATWAAVLVAAMIVNSTYPTLV